MIATIDLFEALKTRFGEPEAKIIVREIEKIETSVETKIEKVFDSKKEILATKIDFQVLEIKIEKVNGQLLVIKWMLGVVLAGIISLVVKSFF